MKSGFRAESSNFNRHCIARPADFFSIHNRARAVLQFAFAGRRVDGWRAEKEADFLRRFIAFALAIKINSGNAAAGFAKWDGDEISGLARATQLGLVHVRLKFCSHYSKFLADIRSKFRVCFDSFVLVLSSL